MNKGVIIGIAIAIIGAFFIIQDLGYQTNIDPNAPDPNANPDKFSSPESEPLEIEKTGKYSLEIDDGTIFDIKYSIKGANILSMNSLQERNSVKINLDSPYAGSLIISMPRQLIDAKISENVDDLFFVFVDGNEVPYTEIKENTVRTLTIAFGQDAKIIEILGASPL